MNRPPSAAGLVFLRKVLAVLILALATCSPTFAHNEQEETTLTLRLEGRKIVLDYRTTFPKTASFTRLKRIDVNQDGSFSDQERGDFLASRLTPYSQKANATFQGQALPLKVESQQALIGESESGLKQLSLEYRLYAELPNVPTEASVFKLEDSAFGWDHLEASSVPGSVQEDVPGNQLRIVFGSPVPTIGQQENKKEAADSQDELMELVSGDLSPTTIAWTLGLSFFLGAIHALTPGHGKTMVAAYLVGSRGTISQAIFLGIVVTITHTASVFLLGVACLFAFQYVMPEKVIPWLGFVSGLLITVVGGLLIYGRATGREVLHGHSHENGHGHSHGHSHSHAHEHSHSHEHHHSHAHEHSHDESSSEPIAREVDDFDEGHSHSHTHSSTDPPDGDSEPSLREPDKESKVSLWALLSLGVSGGMVPCPEALMVLLAAISLNRLLFGMTVLVSFSAGLASLLILIGIFVVTASNRVSKKYYPSDETIRKVSLAAYGFICVLGLVFAVRSLTSAGILVLNL